MKKFTILLAFVLTALAASSQITAKKDNSGNYIAAKPAIDTAGTKTGKTFTDKKGNIFPVYLNKTGKLFIVRISRNGNVYKQYLKIEN